MRPPENLHRKPRNTLFSVQYFVPLSANSECIMKDTPLLQLGNIPVQTGTIAACYDYLSSPIEKIRALEKDGQLIRLKRVHSGLGRTKPRVRTNQNLG